MQCALDIFRGRTQAAGIALAAVTHRFLGFLEGFLGGLNVGLRQLVAIFANGLFGLVHNAVQTVAGFDFFHTAAIFFRVRFGFDAHLLRLVLGQAGRRLNRDLLFFAGGFVLGRNV